MRLWCYSPRFIVMRTFTWPIALLLAGLLFQTVAFAVLNTVVPLWMEQFDAATWEAGLVGAFFFLGNLAGTLLAGGVIRRAGFKGSYRPGAASGCWQGSAAPWSGWWWKAPC